MKTKKYTLLNWPPSRGPMPAWMREPPKYHIPVPLIEELPADVVTSIVQLPLRAKALKLSSAEKKRRAAEKKKTRGRAFYVDEIRHRREQQAYVYASVNAHVETVATLTVEQASILLEGVCNRPMPKQSSSKKKRGHFTASQWDCVSLLPTRDLTVDLNYPLSRTARVTIKPFTRTTRTTHGKLHHRQMDVGYVLWQLARVYKQIYRQHKRWGIWGHDIGDLYFEGLTINNNVLELSMGS